MNEQKKTNIHSIDSVFFKRKKETTFISLNKESTYKNNQKKKGFPKYHVMFKCS